jgi:hypothetical protein
MCARNAFITWVRCRISKSRVRCCISWPCCSADFTATSTGFHTDQAWRHRFEKSYHLTAAKLLPDDDLLGRVDAVNLKNVLGDIQTDRGNLHVDRSPDVIGSNDHLTAIRRRERAPSTTSKPASCTAANLQDCHLIHMTCSRAAFTNQARKSPMNSLRRCQHHQPAKPSLRLLNLVPKILNKDSQVRIVWRQPD